MRSYLLLFLNFIILIIACGEKNTEVKTQINKQNSPLFKLVSSNHSGIEFINQIHENLDVNYYKFMHIYAGAGVAVADFNQDGLVDIYFTSNLNDNKLYINEGELKFKLATKEAGVSGNGGFCTGITIVDINQDGLPDIYVCKSGWYTDKSKLKNILYVNQGVADASNIPVFINQAAEYGLEDDGHSIQASFFDYDKDGDLDVYIVNTPVNLNLANLHISFDEIHNNSAIQDLGSSDHLYRNENGKYINVTAEAGIKPDIGFGLNVCIGDINNDSWPDIYIANDFVQPDFLFINQRNGTFKEKSHEYFKHISYFSMGSDIADINNDGELDLMVLDMSPEDYNRSRTMMGMTSRPEFASRIKMGYHYQYMHNMLHLNNGNGSFSEISQFAGVNKTDWSWSALLADFDNDGWRDIHVTNGIQRDVTNRDGQMEAVEFMKLYNNEIRSQQQLEQARNLIPSVKLSNYLYRNNGDLTFENKALEWGLDKRSFSNGSAYADFDNDGDLDLVCNNVNDKAFLYENKSEDIGNNYLKIKLEGSTKNINGIGSKVILYIDDKIKVAEKILTRGYMSASENIIHFGLGSDKIVNKLCIIWPNNKMQYLENINSNQTITLSINDADKIWEKEPEIQNSLFNENNSVFTTRYKHKENSSDNYEKQVLLPHEYSKLGPFITSGDINGDGITDIFIGGAANQSAQVLAGTSSGKFKEITSNDISSDKSHEDMGAVFFDCDSDGDLDLYVVSGGYEFDEGSKILQDRLYINNGKGKLFKKDNSLPFIGSAGSCVVADDIDNDGDLDLFVGGRVIPGKYPFPPKSYLLLNNGEGIFEDVTQKIAPDFQSLGMVTSALFLDYDADNDKDLIIVGEWMPITFYENDNGTFRDNTKKIGPANSTGWWNCITPADIDGDGDIDFIAGNLGLNYKFHASDKQPIDVFGDDFDANGKWDIVLANNYKGRMVPVRGKECSTEQIPMVGQKFPTFSEFASADIHTIYGDKLKKALHYQAQQFESSFIINDGNGTYSMKAMPAVAQLSVVNGIIFYDFDKDGINDILIAGNMYGSEVETTRADAGIGCYLKGVGNGEYEHIPVTKCKFYTPGDVKDLKLIDWDNKKLILVTNNNDFIQAFSIDAVKL